MRTAWFVAVATLLVAAGGAQADWDQFRHDDENSGVADQPGVVKEPYEPWTFSADGPVVSSPATTTVDGQRLAIFGSYPGQGTPGTLYAVDADGNQVWSAKPLDVGGGYISSPTVEDVDGDGDKEVVVATLDDSTLRLFDAATGSQEWSTQVGNASEDLLASSPAVADVTGDPGNEILLGGSRPGHPGSLLVFSTDGDQLQAVELDGPAWSTPLVKDVDGDGDDEVALTTGVPDTLAQLFPNAKTGGQSLYAFEAGSGGLSVKWQQHLDGKTLASPVADDLDADGEVEVVVGDQSGDVWAVNGTDGTVDAVANELGPLAALSSPLIADVDDDGDLEVAVGSYRGVRSLTLDASTGWSLEGELQLPETGPEGNDDPWVGASLAHEDVDGDGHGDLVGLTVPVNITEPVLESDALPGRVFAVNASRLPANGTQPLWSVHLPDDGGLGGPTLADLDGDGDSEVLAGEGVPLVGNGSALHLVEAANPVIDGVSHDPQDPTDLDDVTFAAAVRDEDGDVDDLAYSWDFGDGNTSTATTPTNRFPDDGVYEVTLTVTDPDGHDWTAVEPVQVDNVPPEVEPSADTTPDDLNVTLHAGAEDLDGTVENVTWALGDGTTAYGDTVDHEYPTGGTYIANATALDDDGDTTTASLEVAVNRFPSLSGPANATVAENETVLLNLTWDDPDDDAVAGVDVRNASGATTDSNATAVQVEWTPGFDVANRSHPNVTRAVDVEAADTGSPTGIDDHRVNVTVENVNRPPEIGPPATTEVFSGVSHTLEGDLVDPDGNPLALNATGLPPNGSVARTADGWTLSLDPALSDTDQTYDVTVEADDGQSTDETTFTLLVKANNPPKPSIDLDPGMVNASTPWNETSVTLDASGTTEPDGHGLAAFTWLLPHATLSGEVVEAAFEAGGVYDVDLVVEDGTGVTASETATIPVDDALTGTVGVYGQGPPLTGSRVVPVTVTRADGTPVDGASVDVTLRHAEVPGLENSEGTTTDPDGEASVTFEGDGDAPAFVPGEHEIVVDVSAPSAPGAVLDDTETLRMTDTFPVDGDTGPIVYPDPLLPD